MVLKLVELVLLAQETNKLHATGPLLEFEMQSALSRESID